MTAAVGAHAARGGGGERQGRGAEAAFGGDAADIPVGAAAAGAVVDLVLMVDDAIAAGPRIVGQRLDAALQSEARHGLLLRVRIAPSAQAKCLSAPENPLSRGGKSGRDRLTPAQVASRASPSTVSASAAGLSVRMRETRGKRMARPDLWRRLAW